MIVYQLSHANNWFVAGKTTATVIYKACSVNLAALCWIYCQELTNTFFNATLYSGNFLGASTLKTKRVWFKMECLVLEFSMCLTRLFTLFLLSKCYFFVTRIFNCISFFLYACLKGEFRFILVFVFCCSYFLCLSLHGHLLSLWIMLEISLLQCSLSDRIQKQSLSGQWSVRYTVTNMQRYVVLWFLLFCGLVSFSVDFCCMASCFHWHLHPQDLYNKLMSMYNTSFKLKKCELSLFKPAFFVLCSCRSCFKNGCSSFPISWTCSVIFVSSLFMLTTDHLSNLCSWQLWFVYIEHCNKHYFSVFVCRRIPEIFNKASDPPLGGVQMLSHTFTHGKTEFYIVYFMRYMIIVKRAGSEKSPTAIKTTHKLTLSTFQQSYSNHSAE